MEFVTFLWFSNNLLSCFVDEDSALSEVSLCTNGGTTTTETSEDEEENPPPRKKWKISVEEGKNTRKSRNKSRFGGNGGKEMSTSSQRGKGKSQGNQSGSRGRTETNKSKGRTKEQGEGSNSSRSSKVTNQERKKTKQKEARVGRSSSSKTSKHDLLVVKLYRSTYADAFMHSVYKYMYILSNLLHTLFMHRSEPVDYVKWTIEPIAACTDKQPPPQHLPQFVHVQGPSPRTKIAKTPLEMFQLFFTNIILDLIVHQTKLFASQKGKVLEFCVEELMGFIGLNIAMGCYIFHKLKIIGQRTKFYQHHGFPV